MAIDTAELGFLLLLQMITEDRMAAGGDDGSAASGRALAILGAWERVGRAANAPATPFEPAAAPAIAALRGLIDRAEPILARVARPSIRPPS